MKALDRKLLRDLAGMKGQVAAIVLVIAAGLATFVMSLTMIEALKRSREAYYERYRFGHVFASMKRAPRSLAERIAEIPGVARVETRIVVEVSLRVAGMNEPAVGRLISVPELGEPVLNRLHLRRGRQIERGRGEAIVSEAFAEAHGLTPGDGLHAVVNGKFQKLTVAGVAISPEYVFQIGGAGIFPDDERFGVLWVGYEELAAAFDMLEAFNDLSLQRMPGSSEEEIIRQLDRLTEPYGGLGAYGRRDQVSDRYLSDELAQLRVMATAAPSIFLGIAAFLLQIVVSRLVASQREQIAMLKAFGYTSAAIARHYLMFAGVIVILGATAGVCGGAWLGRSLTHIYADYYRFPTLDYRLDAWVAAAALGIGLAAGLGAVLTAVRRAVALPPAEAMQPEPPPAFRTALVERAGLGRLLSPVTRMMLRQIERRPVKSLLTVVGIALAVAVLVLGNSMKDAIGYLIERQTAVLQREDLTVTLVEPRSDRAARELRRLPGVLHLEPFRTVPVRLRSGHRSRLLALSGVPPDSELVRFPRAGAGFLEIPQEGGMILSAKLGEVLELGLGESVEVEVLEGKRPRFRLHVAGFSEDLTGLAAHMDLGALNRIMKEGPAVSGARMRVDAAALEGVYGKLRGMPFVAGVEIKTAAIRKFRETMEESLLTMQAFNIFFATVIAFGVVYNSARVAFAERNHELATLRVLGFTRGETGWILVGELFLLTVLAVPLGWMLGWVFVVLSARGMDTEFYRIPAVVYPSTYAVATFVTLAAAGLSGCAVFGRVRKLDMIGALKCRD